MSAFKSTIVLFVLFFCGLLFFDGLKCFLCFFQCECFFVLALTNVIKCASVTFHLPVYEGF